MDAGPGECVDIHMVEGRTCARGKDSRICLGVLLEYLELYLRPVPYLVELVRASHSHRNQYSLFVRLVSRFIVLLVPEVADAGEKHGEAEAVGGGDDFGIADGAAGLNHRR